MGNTPPSSSSSGRRRKSSSNNAAERAKKVVGDIGDELKRSVKKLDEDHPAAQLIDSMCGGYFDEDKYRQSRSASFYSEESVGDGSRTEDDATYDDTATYESRSKKDATSVEEDSYVSHSDYESAEPKRRSGSGRKVGSVSFDTEDADSKITAEESQHSGPLLSKPLASSFAKRCYFTKAGIGKSTQHYEGLTLTGNIVLMLAAAMKLKGCPTICDEDLRRVEQTYPNQFSRLPDELLLSSGWRRISKYCHFSNKPIPDGVPFFHSKQRLHPTGGYYFLLAGAVGMIRPIDVEPLTRDTLVLLETDFPTQCDAVPDVLIREPDQWTLVNKFCFFSGGPINTEEDVYYQADFDGNPIFMLAFLSPSLTPEELYKLSESGEPGLKSCAAVHEVESVYDLTERDFNDLKLYHLGPCRALPQYILQPQAWTKVLPPHFLAARQTAMMRAQDYEQRHGIPPSQLSNPPTPQNGMLPPQGADFAGNEGYYDQQQQWQDPQSQMPPQQMQPTSPEEMQNQNMDPGMYAGQPQYNPDMYPQQSPHHDAMYHQQPIPQDNGMYQPQPSPHEGMYQQHPQPDGGMYQQHPQPDGGMYQMPPPGHDPRLAAPQDYYDPQQQPADHSVQGSDFQREVEEEGAFAASNIPMDEANASRYPVSPPGMRTDVGEVASTQKMDPPDDEPPSLTSPKQREVDGVSPANYEEHNGQYPQYYGEGQGAPDPEDPMPLASPEPVQNGDGKFFTPENQAYYAPPENAGGGDPNHNYDPAHQDYYVAEGDNHGYNVDPSAGGEYAQNDFPSPHEQFTTPMSDAYGQGEGQYGHDFAPPDGRFPSHYPPQDGHFPTENDVYPHAHATSPHEEFATEDFTLPSDAEGDQFGEGGDVYPPHGEPYYESEEKKVAQDEHGENGMGYKPAPLTVDTDAEFTPIKREGYKLGPSPSPRSQLSAKSNETGTPVSQSSALRGAQELLKKNRRRRLEMALKTGSREPPNPQQSFEQEHPGSPQMDEQSAGTWESGTEISGSVVSGSSVWTDQSNPTDRSSRRALILQMAKARMKTNKDGQSPSAGSGMQGVEGQPIEEEDPTKLSHDGDMEQHEKATVDSTTILSGEANPADIDIAGDLD